MEHVVILKHMSMLLNFHYGIRYGDNVQKYFTLPFFFFKNEFYLGVNMI